ncbi:hypothetical protein ACJJIW_21775 [Microbulbifer sp. JMSA004]|uniref:hypothetical protein n=1 Tax=Microbulbifer sp. JMSA004 TaxID=3243370 RepID=UPI0040398BE2
MIYTLEEDLSREHTVNVHLAKENPSLLIKLMQNKGKPIKDKWPATPPPIRYITSDIDVEALKKVYIPDIVSLGLNFCLRPFAYNKLKNDLEPYSEFLPLSHIFEEETWHLLHCTNEIDAIVKEKSRYEIEEDGQVGLIEHAYLDESKVKGQLLFSVKGYEGVYTHGDTLKNLLNEHTISGITFRKYQ